MRKIFLKISKTVLLLSVIFTIISCNKGIKDTINNPEIPSRIVSGMGATLPYVEYEAENGSTNGSIYGPNRDYLSWEAEASGRKYVRLDSTGKYVQWTASASANTMVVRYSIPDGTSGTLSLYVNGVYKQKVYLDSKYAWVYGNFPWTNYSESGNGHKIFDEVNFFTSGDIPAGATVKLQKNSDDTLPYYLIDLIDLEKVSAFNAPSNSLSITSYGATANDGTDDRTAIINCINAAKSQGKTVWIPAGEFNINNETIPVDNVTIGGAGMWYSRLVGARSGFKLNGNNCRFYNFSIMGTTSTRDDNSDVDNAFSGSAGTGSVIEGIWVEHKKCGVWINGGTSGLTITKSRFRNLMADAVNFCAGASNCTVSNSHIRFSGDDALATWSPSGSSGCNGNTFDSNTIQLPWLASGIAVYGGANHKVINNLICDIVTGGAGICISTDFTPVPLTGTITVEGNTLYRCGSNEQYLGYAPGAIWVVADDSDISSATINITSNNINESTTSGICLQGSKFIYNTNISDTAINNSTGYGILIHSNAKGNTKFTNVTVSNATKGGIANNAGSNFEIWKNSGNIGW